MGMLKPAEPLEGSTCTDEACILEETPAPPAGAGAAAGADEIVFVEVEVDFVSVDFESELLGVSVDEGVLEVLEVFGSPAEVPAVGGIPPEAVTLGDDIFLLSLFVEEAAPIYPIVPVSAFISLEPKKIKIAGTNTSLMR